MESVNKPRVALCISGQPRFFEEAFPLIKKNILDQHLGVDIFMHFWYSDGDIGKRFAKTSDTTREEGNGTVIENTPDKIRSLYHPTIIKYEPQVDFSNLIKPEYESARDKTNPFATFSMWTSIKHCNDLKRSYEKEHAFTYDVVIRCRFDLKITSALLLEETKDLTLYTSGHNPRTDIVEDIIFYGKSNVIDLVSQMVDELDNNFRLTKKWSNEALLATHCLGHGIDIVRNPRWNFTLARGQRTTLDTIWYVFKTIKTKFHL